MTRAKRTAVFVLVLFTALILGLEASARTERLRWSHSDSAVVDSYRVYVGIETGVYTSQVDVGIPATDSTGAFVYDLEVDDAATVYIAVTAWDGGLESTHSNEQTRSPTAGGTALGTPGRPTLVLP
jgi:hypothetical protein